MGRLNEFTGSSVNETTTVSTAASSACFPLDTCSRLVSMPVSTLAVEGLVTALLDLPNLLPFLATDRVSLFPGFPEFADRSLFCTLNEPERLLKVPPSSSLCYSNYLIF